MTKSVSPGLPQADESDLLLVCLHESPALLSENYARSCYAGRTKQGAQGKDGLPEDKDLKGQLERLSVDYEPVNVQKGAERRYMTRSKYAHGHVAAGQDGAVRPARGTSRVAGPRGADAKRRAQFGTAEAGASVSSKAPGEITAAARGRRGLARRRSGGARYQPGVCVCTSCCFHQGRLAAKANDRKVNHRLQGSDRDQTAKTERP